MQCSQVFKIQSIDNSIAFKYWLQELITFLISDIIKESLMIFESYNLKRLTVFRQEYIGISIN